MVKVFSMLISDRGFDSRIEYGVALKFMISIHPLNGLIECGILII